MMGRGASWRERLSEEACELSNEERERERDFVRTQLTLVFIVGRFFREEVKKRDGLGVDVASCC